MAKNLLIVESPAKAKTIEKILGADFQVKSCFGHIRDLAKEDMGIDIPNGYAPTYLVSDDKQKVVSELRALAKKSGEVWLATDEDREGEAISWHLCEVLNLNPATTKRIVFHEITKPAIQKAVAHPRLVNMDLVNAQQARRILDRLVGFEMSPVLWRKVQRNLSAGRVQSVAVRILVEREREINAFEPVSSFRIEGIFHAPDIHGRGVNFKAESPTKPKDAPSARKFLEQCIGAEYVVQEVQVKPGKRSPQAPFTTSTLQQEASRKLGYSVSRTMRVAQTLYENGHITYMRTDSVSLSDTALQGAREAITGLYGEKYHQQRKFKNKNESAQEAHEAIRPTDMQASRIGDSDGQRLYELIWKRTMASQMADAILERTTAKIGIFGASGVTPEAYSKELKVISPTLVSPDAVLVATGEVVKFDGFMRLYMEGHDDEHAEDTEGMLPPLKAGQKLHLNELRATERFTRASPRYTEAALVKKLEELGIGRPSTYASTISTIQARGYVERRDKDGTLRPYQLLVLKEGTIKEEKLTENVGAEKGKLFPTDLGTVVTDFLTDHFKRVMDYSFTARIEEEFDEVAHGKIEWQAMIDAFYKPFHQMVELAQGSDGRAAGERTLGKDPVSGKPVIVRLGRFGPMVQIGSADDEDKPRFASLRDGQSIETISYEEALDLFKLPMALGLYEGDEVEVNIGRFGPYLKWREKFISLPKGAEPLEVTLEQSIRYIQEKERADAPIGLYEGFPVTKGVGRFGPFLKWNDLYINVPKAYNFEALSKGDIETLISTKVEKEANRYIQNWESEKITIENGRWGPFINWGKKKLNLDRKKDGTKPTPEEAALLTLDEVKKMIVAQVPGAFEKKTAAKKTTAGKATAKKPTTRKASPPKGAAAKAKPKAKPKPKS